MNLIVYRPPVSKLRERQRLEDQRGRERQAHLRKNSTETLADTREMRAAGISSSAKNRGRRNTATVAGRIQIKFTEEIP